MRLIDAEDVLRYLKFRRNRVFESPTSTLDAKFEITEAVWYVENRTDTVDAAPVVHCRDCRWGQKDDAGVMHCHKYHIHKETDGYCDDGARMDLPEGEEDTP